VPLKKTIYHFLDPEFGYPFVEYFYEKDIQNDFEVVLVFSSKNFLPNRRAWNPLRILDWYNAKNLKSRIFKKYEKFEFQINFVSSVSNESFLKNISKNTKGICTGFNQIFKRRLIDTFTDFVNIHPSLLPFYRGPTPVEWCLKNKEEYTGWTMHRVNEKIDDGEILFQDVLYITSKSANEIKTEISDQAKVILYNYLIQNSVFQKNKIRADKYYFNKVNYKSFFRG